MNYPNPKILHQPPLVKSPSPPVVYLPSTIKPIGNAVGCFSLPNASPTFRTCHVLQRHACWYKNQSSASVKAEADKVRKGWPKLLLIMKWQKLCCGVKSFDLSYSTHIAM
ncbi:hypothetical protein V6N12_055979 [Hibiscus sabdariffa]|uniref:Uncharacterized protein n=1 Tax=Hibiscus sabdariffa TaxID=183260 RepID=A0ABR2CR50_9ROSI